MVTIVGPLVLHVADNCTIFGHFSGLYKAMVAFLETPNTNPLAART